jgi:dTDP-glucose pyrophosphorylase
MLVAGATKLCFVISPGKSDILEYYAGEMGAARICYLVQQQPAGLCDAIFTAVPFVSPDEIVVIGLPDTLWFPTDGLCLLPDHELSLLLFPVDHPELFDAVVTDETDAVVEVRVKQINVETQWVWGALKMPGAILHELYDLWQNRDPRDEYLGTLITAFIALGGRARGIKAGQSYVDVGTVNGYREANLLLERRGDTSPTALVPKPAKLAATGAYSASACAPPAD